jgi:hypothetical protein
MVAASERPGRSGAVLGGAGAIAFSVSTLVGVVVANTPGGNYSASNVAQFLAHGHRVAVIVVAHLALLGVLGLICLLAYLRDAISVVPENRRAGSIVWGTGLAAAASFAVGWGVIVGQVIAHLEGGKDIVIPPAVTYLISEIGVVFIFGCGAMLLGFALIVLMLSSRAVLPVWLRRLTLVAGVCGITGLAFFPFFVLMLLVAVVGAWLLTATRRSTSAALTAYERSPVVEA